ncbi:MAG: CdaR family protein [Bacillota bacterium]|nr:CdaR family protein [Bacillota bacterium]
MRRLLADNRAVWAISFVIALILWGFAARNPTQQQYLYSAPVELVNLPADVVATDVSPSRVTLTLASSGANRPDPTGLRARVDLSGARAGTRTYSVAEVPVPRGVSLVSILPDRVRVTLERREQRTLAVHVVAVGQPAREMAVTETAASPPQVTVEGPSSRIWRISTVEVRVDVAGARMGFRQTTVPVALDASGLEVHGVQFRPGRITVDVTVEQAPPTVSLPVRAVVTGVPAAGYAVAGATVDPAQVVVAGDPVVLAGLQVVETAPVDVTGARADLSQRVALRLPPGVTLKQPQAVTVTVSIRRKS